MGPPEDLECDDSEQSVSFVDNGIDQNVPVEQTFILHLPTTEEFDEGQEDVDYLSLASGHSAADHSTTVVTDILVPQSLIDRVLASPEQTYEQLLASFTYLTAGLYFSTT